MGVEAGSGANRPIRLLEVVGNAIRGGAETYVKNLVAHLPPDRYRIVCLCPFESEFTRELRELGLEVLIVPMRHEPSWDSIRSTVTLIQSHAIDLVHAHLPNAHLLAGLAGCLTSTPVVATLHGIYFSAHEFSISRTTGSHLIVVCQEAFNHALSLGMPPERVTAIRNGVDLTRFHPGGDGHRFRARIGINDEVPLVGFVGRLNTEKGPDLFLEAAAQVHEVLPDVQFVMVGEGPMESQLRAAISARGMGFVRMAGPSKEIWEVYPALDVLLQTSRSEGMPLVLIEAMACGVPVVARGVGGVVELIQMGSTGLIAGDIAGTASAFPGEEGTAKALLSLLADRERMIKMGQAGRLRAQELFGIEQTARRTDELFSRLVGSRLPRLAPSPVEIKQ